MAHHYLVEAIDGHPELIELSGAEAHHALTVSRVRPGERLTVGDGRGTIAECTVIGGASGVLRLAVEAVRTEPRDAPRVVLAQALAKGGRDELAVQAATELGVDAVLPWQAARSVSRWSGPKLQKGRERWGTIAREAAKQSLRAWVPEVEALHDTAALAARNERVLVLHPDAAEPLASVALDERDLVIVVGPEGGVSAEELALLTGHGALAVRLGRGVLRTSTAGPAALAVLNTRLGRW